MRGLFINEVLNQNRKRTHCGYLTKEDDFSGDIKELEELVEADKAYRVNISEAEDRLKIILESSNRHVEAETKGKIDKEGKGRTVYICQTTEEPEMPGECQNPHVAIEAYAEYALEHQGVEGIEIDNFNWDRVLKSENQYR